MKNVIKADAHISPKHLKSVFGDSYAFAARVEMLNEHACDFQLDYDDYTVYGEPCGSDHWLAMNLMWLVEEYQGFTCSPVKA